MLSFAFIWAFVLLPVPLLVRLFVPPRRTRAEALRVPFFASLADAAGEIPAHGATVQRRRKIQSVIVFLCWVCAVTGLARPEILGEPQVIETSARDLVLAVDISGSMDTRDMAGPDGAPMQRLDAVKAVVNDFIASRDGDRIALIVFGSRAFLQTPFTEDLTGAAELMAGTAVGMAGPHTAIGDAIGLALRTFEASEVEQKLLVLLSDGTDTNSQMSPLNATEIAASEGVKIYTIGVGDPAGTGEQRLDQATLEAIAERAGGDFYFAGDAEGLSQIYDEIDALNPRLVESVTYQPKDSIGHYAFALAFCLGLAAVLVARLFAQTPPLGGRRHV